MPLPGLGLPGQLPPGQQQPQQAATAQATPQVVAASSAMASQQDSSQGSSSSGQSGVEVLLRILTNSAVAQLQLDHLQRASKNAELQTAIGIQGKPRLETTLNQASARLSWAL